MIQVYNHLHFSPFFSFFVCQQALPRSLLEQHVLLLRGAEHLCWVEDTSGGELLRGQAFMNELVSLAWVHLHSQWTL